MVTYTNQFDIPSSCNSLAEIELAIGSIHANRGASLVISPSTLAKRRGVFHDAALLQALITWVRLSPDAQLKISSRNQGLTKETLLVESCDYSVGIAALALASSISVDGFETQRVDALAPAYQRIDHAFEGKFDQLTKGRCVDLLCVSGAQRQFIKPLFSRPNRDAVKDKYSLKPTVRGLAIQAHPRASEFLSESVVLALSTLTHELFENTQDHATTDLRGQPYRRHVEGMLVSWLRLTDDLVKEDFFRNKQLRDYWATLASSQTDREAVAGICFCFIDSGPGMAARLKGKDHFAMSIEEVNRPGF